MNTHTNVRSGFASADRSIEAIRMAVNIAQSECICQLQLSVCLLTDAGERAAIQPFLYSAGVPA